MIIGFLLVILVGIASVSVHYRKLYEIKKMDNIRLKTIIRRFIKMGELE